MGDDSDQRDEWTPPATTPLVPEPGNVLEAFWLHCEQESEMAFAKLRGARPPAYYSGRFDAYREMAEWLARVTKISKRHRDS